MTTDPTESIDPESKHLWQLMAKRYGWKIGVFREAPRKPMKVERRNPARRRKYIWKTT